MDEIINDYHLVQPFQNQDSGFSRWTYGTKNGSTFFLKEFLDPIYPVDPRLDPAMRNSRIADCKAYEARKIHLYQTINALSDGNLVRIVEFFRCHSHYYISTPMVPAQTLTFDQIAALPFEDIILLCKTAAHSLMQLHEAHIVHSDIKDKNLLVKQTQTGKLVAKIIDFDCSFFEHQPPDSEDELGGDQIYLAPEACLFICGEPVSLTCKIDVFSLGLLFHQYMTGTLPGFDTSEYFYAHEAVLDGNPLIVSPDLPDSIRLMLQQMLEADPEQRCDMRQVFHILDAFGSICRQHVSTPVQPQDFFHTAGDL
ncbi:protein kinase domain-containing protein [Butyricicoccus sp.]|uniref:protein kinase domain-containing protein n=1 Tax=Butyricicoccus sp. TaxID=2049021 RepID=UPI003F152890